MHLLFAKVVLVELKLKVSLEFRVGGIISIQLGESKKKHPKQTVGGLFFIYMYIGRPQCSRMLRSQNLLPGLDFFSSHNTVIIKNIKCSAGLCCHAREISLFDVRNIV